MAFLGSFICLVAGLISYVRDRKFYSPTVLFAIFWTLLLFLSGLQLYGIYSASDFAIIIIVFGTLCFVIGGCFAKKSSKIRKTTYVLNKKRFKVALVICLFALYLNISFLIAFASSGFDINYIYTIMASIVGGEETELSDLYNPTLLIIQQFIGYPILYTLVPIAIVEYITTKNRLYLSVAILLSLIRFLFDFRRTYIVIIIVFIIFVYIIRKQIRGKNNFNKIVKMSLVKKILLVFTILFLILGFTYLSSVRRGEDDGEYSLISNFYYYYVGSIPYMSLRLNAIHNISYTFGLTSFRGLVAPIFALLVIFGIQKPHLMELANQNVDSLHNTVMLISDSHPFNSYATCFFEFYLDGGLVGVIFISFLFGWYAQSLYYDMRINKSNRYIVKYSLFVSMFLYLSVLHFNGVVVCYILPFILERLFYKKEITISC